MTTTQEITQKTQSKVAEYTSKIKQLDLEDPLWQLKNAVASYNNEQGNLTDYDCSICNNKGFVAFVDEINEIDVYKKCSCVEVRNSKKKIKQSGLESLLDTCTFEAFETTEPWQQALKEKAMEYLNININWFFIGGQVGAGKTHLCTAICKGFLDKAIATRYMLWREEIVSLKANSMNEKQYLKLIDPLKNTEVLYIDDFFKTEAGKLPTTADVNIAFEILNHRYINPKLKTIISCEKTVDEILDIDEAVGSRIAEKSKGYKFNISKNRNKNYRLKD